ncbi:LysE family translocator [Pseudooctadecabacter jejudonensis]|nr:LysE family transporter [Pseudooctadecabacter jejudonensis]
MTTYFFTLVALLLAPGQVMLLTVIRAAGGDVRGALVFTMGAATGSVLIVSAVCWGMSLISAENAGFMAYSKYVMIGYIAWIAYGMWTRGVDVAGAAAPQSGLVTSYMAGLITNMTSPYMMILFPLVIPEVLDITVIEMPDFLIVVLTTLGAEVLSAAVLVGLALQMRRLIRSARATRVFNRSLAGCLMAGGTAMAFM